jgi:hypothetical protein
MNCGGFVVSVGGTLMHYLNLPDDNTMELPMNLPRPGQFFFYDQYYNMNVINAGLAGVSSSLMGRIADTLRTCNPLMRSFYTMSERLRAEREERSAQNLPARTVVLRELAPPAGIGSTEARTYDPSAAAFEVIFSFFVCVLWKR